jgi:hypothetical protein
LEGSLLQGFNMKSLTHSNVYMTICYHVLEKNREVKESK